MKNLTKSTKWMLAVLIAAHILTFVWVAVTFGFLAADKMFSVPYIWAAVVLILHKITFSNK